MTVPFTARIAAKESVLINTFDDGESVLLNLDTENYFGLNDSGSRMWELLTGEQTIDAAFMALQEEYDIDPDTLRSDLAAFIDELVEHQLVDVEQVEEDA